MKWATQSSHRRSLNDATSVLWREGWSQRCTHLCGLSSVICSVCIKVSCTDFCTQVIFPVPSCSSTLSCVDELLCRVKCWLKSCLLIFIHSSIKITPFNVSLASICLGGKTDNWVGNRTWILALLLVLSSWEKVRDQHSLKAVGHLHATKSCSPVCRHYIKLALLAGLATLSATSGTVWVWVWRASCSIVSLGSELVRLVQLCGVVSAYQLTPWVSLQRAALQGVNITLITW